MTDQTTPKVAKLNPEEWKQLVVLNAVQLQNYLQSIPGHTEGGISGLSDQHLAQIMEHQARGHTFMRAWQRSSYDVPAQQSAQAQPDAAANGASAPKKGGWPKGRKRTPKTQPGAQQ